MRINKKGFTMLEVIAVVVVLGILMVVLMPRLTSGTDKAKELGVNKEFKDFSDSIETMFTENSRIPGDAAKDVDVNTAMGAAPVVPVAGGFAEKFNTYIDDYFAIHVASTAANAESVNLTRAASTLTLGQHYATQAEDPFGARYGVIISRDNPGSPGIYEKVLVYSRGKSLTTGRADYLTLTVYKDGKITKCNAGFKGDIQSIHIDTNNNGVFDTAEYKLGYVEPGKGGAGKLTLPDEGPVGYLTEAVVRTMVCVNN